MEKKSGFYGGKFGVWLPVLFMLAGMLASTIVGGDGLARLTGITFLPWPRVFCWPRIRKIMVRSQ